MVTRDISRAVTIEQLKRQYNLDNKQMKQAIEQSKTNLIKVENELNGYIDSTTKELKKIQDQVDGNITTWFFSGVPTLEDNPAVEWVEDQEKNNHLGDLYYDKDTGYAYRFTLEGTTYSWMKLTDSDISEALALANTAKDTADSKRRVFIVQPTPPYDSGDFWLKDKELYICQVSKETGLFEENDFIIATKYTDDTYAKKVEQNLTIVSGKVTTIEQGIDEINTTMEENKYYVDADGNKQLISSDLSEIKQTTKDYEILVDTVDTLDTTTENNRQEMLEKFDGYVTTSDLVQLEQKVQTIQTDTYTKTEINTKLIDGSVKKVSTTSGTFDEDGMHYKKSNAPTSSTINHLGVEVKSTENNQSLLFAGYDGELNESIVKTENLTVNKYLVCGNSRIENYGTGGGMFVL